MADGPYNRCASADRLPRLRCSGATAQVNAIGGRSQMLVDNRSRSALRWLYKADPVVVHEMPPCRRSGAGRNCATVITRG